VKRRGVLRRRKPSAEDMGGNGVLQAPHRRREDSDVMGAVGERFTWSISSR
jgi:hypothetical protein